MAISDAQRRFNDSKPAPADRDDRKESKWDAVVVENNRRTRERIERRKRIEAHQEARRQREEDPFNEIATDA
jgi:hypothetical protein